MANLNDVVTYLDALIKAIGQQQQNTAQYTQNLQEVFTHNDGKFKSS
jgi:hypothetical protein